MADPTPVIFLPGIVMPAALSYAALVAQLGADVAPVVKELEVYEGDEPPSSYSLLLEVRGLERAADEAGFDTFHLVGNSAGGAVALMFAATHGDRLRSLALLEPAWAGHDMSRSEREVWDESAHVASLREFMQVQLEPGVEPPAPAAGPAPEWMAKRPAGIAAVSKAFESATLPVDRLHAFDRPVLYVLGGLSNRRYFGAMAERLVNVFTDYAVERFPERHHFDPPHRIEPARVAALLRAVWRRADSTGASTNA